jgi:hypothetical protein
VPFHPTLSLATVPHDMTTGCAGGYATSREGELIFANDDHGASHASAFLNCVTVDSAVAVKTAVGSVSRLGKDGTVSRMNPKDTKTNAFSEAYYGTGRQGSPERPAVTVIPPPLPVIPVNLDLEGNFAFTEENKPKWNSFKTKMEGPTEYSCWIVPGLIAMGGIPLGRAWRRRQVKSSVHTRIDATSQLILAGLNTFVSLLSEEEEALAEQKTTVPLWKERAAGGMGIYAANPAGHKKDEYSNEEIPPYIPGKAIENNFTAISADCKAQLKNVVLGLKAQVDNWTADINLNKVDDPKDLRYEASRKEELRLRTRRNITIEALEVARREMSSLPTSRGEFIRMPLRQDCAPTITDFMPMIWKLEEKIKNGQRLFIYSLDGHGRVGLVCGVLLGRMYGLTPRESLFRMQVYHDCIHSESRRLVAVNCPQLIDQQDLLSTVLRSSNKVFEGVTLRSQLDPETHATEIQHLERGSQMGVAGVMVTQEKAKRLAATTHHDAGGRAARKWTAEARGSTNPMIVDILDDPPPAVPPNIITNFSPSNGGYTKKGLSARNLLASQSGKFSFNPDGTFSPDGAQSPSSRKSPSPPKRTPKKSRRQMKEDAEDEAKRVESEKSKGKLPTVSPRRTTPYTEEEMLIKIEPTMHDEHKAAMETYVRELKRGVVNLGLNLSTSTTEVRSDRPSSGESTSRYKKIYTPKLIRPPPAEAPLLPLLRAKHGNIA